MHYSQSNRYSDIRLRIYIVHSTNYCLDLMIKQKKSVYRPRTSHIVIYSLTGQIFECLTKMIIMIPIQFKWIISTVIMLFFVLFWCLFVCLCVCCYSRGFVWVVLVISEWDSVYLWSEFFSLPGRSPENQFYSTQPRVNSTLSRLDLE